MAGIGFELQKVLETEKNYFPKFTIAFKSMFVTSGPWIISIISILLIKLFLEKSLDEILFLNFINVLIYSFIFSMILSAPFVNIITRYLSDVIYINKLDSIFPIFISGILVIGSISFICAYIFIFYFTALQSDIFTICSFFTSLSILWLVMVFVSTLKDYNLVTYSFLIGMMVTLFLLYFVLNNNLKELIESFTIGTLLTISILIARLKFDFESKKIFDFTFMKRSQYLPLFFSGFFLNLGIWIDKIIYWHSSKGTELTKGFFFFPEYDFVMFISYLIIIPTTAYFTVYIETVFYENQRDYFSSIENKKPLNVIKSYEEKLKNAFTSGLIKITVFQFSCAFLFVIITQYLLDISNINIASIPILRIVVFAVSLQMILNVIVIFLYYFNYQKEVLFISLVFFFSNLLLTLYMKDLPYEFVSYSYFNSLIITLFFALIIALYKMERISFYTFSKNNV